MLEGWCTEEELETAFDFSTPINSDIELWANWVRAFEVAFENNGGAVIASQTVTEGEKPSCPSSRQDRDMFSRDGFLTTVPFPRDLILKRRLRRTLRFTPNGQGFLS